MSVIEGSYHQVQICQLIADCISVQWLMILLKSDLPRHNYKDEKVFTKPHVVLKGPVHPHAGYEDNKINLYGLH